MNKKHIKRFAKELLNDVDSEIQLMHGSNVRLFGTTKVTQQLIDILENLKVDAKLLKVTPRMVKDFQRGVGMGMALAHFEHRANKNENQ